MSGDRAEGLIQVVIMLAIGSMAGAASFTHVHDVTVAHGQPNWIGWANATVVELMSIALGLELRRRARNSRPTRFVASALVFFVLVSLAAQVVEAESSVIGWLAAALPAIGFLVLAKVVLSRTAASRATATEPTVIETEDPVEPADLVDTTDSTADAVMPQARHLAELHQRTTGKPIPAAVLADRIGVPADTAARILSALGDNTRHPVAPTGRINGAVVQETPA